jgi:hypothetical protein
MSDQFQERGNRYTNEHNFTLAQVRGQTGHQDLRTFKPSNTTEVAKGIHMEMSTGNVVFERHSDSRHYNNQPK